MSGLAQLTYFYPRPPRGGRPSCRTDYSGSIGRFLSTPSARRATPCGRRSRQSTRFLSTPSARRATWARSPPKTSGGFLSTPSARRATLYIPYYNAAGEISIHALREEGDRCRPAHLGLLQKFLSTPSARRATGDALCGHRQRSISIHALREEGDLWQLLRLPDHRSISIHALREEGDGGGVYQKEDEIIFLSTPSARRATSVIDASI